MPSIPSDPFAIIAVALAVLCSYIGARRLRASRLRTPPGPRGLPLLGNLFQIPNSDSKPWETYRAWSRQYNSDIIHVSALGTNIIVVNSLSIANELFDKRSTVYSDRPQMTMYNKLCGLDWSMGGLPYGNAWRETRKMARHDFHSDSVSQFHPHQLKSTRKLLLDLLQDGNDFVRAIHLWAGSMILSITYDINVETHDDPYFVMAEKASRFIIDQLAAGYRWVDMFPILGYIPEWFPGAAFKREANRMHAISDRVMHDPLDMTYERMTAGDIGPCAATSLIEAYCEPETQEGTEEENSADWAIRSALGSLYLAGAETVVVTLETFFLAMNLHPEVQWKAQKDIDKVVGPHRLPDFSDKDALPYLTAVLKEVLRWRPIAPLAVPHMTTADDVYGEYLIPKGSTVVANAWSILQDEAVYPNPSTFDPERFLNRDGTLNLDVQDPSVAVFGFGRRVCPGRFLALDSLWLSMTSILATFDIARARDVNGAEIVPCGEFTGGVISSPKPFKCDVRPRSKEHESMLSYVELAGEDPI